MKKKILFLIILFFFVGCLKNPPTAEDGKLQLQVVIVDKSGLVQVKPELGYAPLANARAMLESKDYFLKPNQPIRYQAYSDSRGVVRFNDLPLGRYTLTVVKELPLSVSGQNPDTLRITGNKLIDLIQTFTMDTLKTNVAFKSSLVINEIYYCGPKNSSYYFYDQFIELYNNSDSTVYLDGVIIGQGKKSFKPDQDSVDYVQVIKIFQFPGQPRRGRQYPLAPHEYLVIAQDAIDHSQFVATALDLSTADWEFYDPYGFEVDNPAPNIVNALPDNPGDFLISLWHDFIILADGSAFFPGEVVDENIQYYHIPLNTVIDGVEYSSNGNSIKLLTSRIDGGFAGVGLSRYSGKSVQRRLPGFDTNNSSLDFIILNHPTPGY
ncbi:MAG: DUF4876 domain-containing protein [Calditrichaeota bacterium]|nr:MAG: DUF4876 domain-containing protein [Calditrichota bacterium]